jgi:DNA-binding NarL/FixJ family response regulator
MRRVIGPNPTPPGARDARVRVGIGASSHAAAATVALRRAREIADQLRDDYAINLALLGDISRLLSIARVGDVMARGEVVNELAVRAGVRLEAEGGDVGARPDPTAVGRGAPRRSRYDLTRRELEVLDLVAAGWLDREIAEELFISRKTVIVHVANIRGKLGAASRVEMLTSAMRAGLVKSPS